MTDTAQYDLLVLGSGPGGYVAAIRASQLGLKTAVVEKERVGGVCANVGCIPSKSLIHQAENYLMLTEMEDTGIKVDRSGFDYEKVYKKSRLAAQRLSKGVEYLLKKNKIELIHGHARFLSAQEVIINQEKKISAKNILIATGAKPKKLQGFEFNEDSILSSTGALGLSKLPKSMLILGAGAIGIEFAHIFNAFGVQVHLVEAMQRILPLEDAEISSTLHKILLKRKISIHTSTIAARLEKLQDDLWVDLKDSTGKSERLAVEKVLVAVGRSPNTEDIGLENAGIKTEKGFISVGHYYQTAVPGVYAVGDVVGAPMLAHAASKAGEIAVEKMAGRTPDPGIDPLTVPSAVYCRPEIASFGLNQEKALLQNIEFEKAVFPMRGCGRAVAIEQSDGFVMILHSKKSGHILGAHIIGAGAAEIIHEILAAQKGGLGPEVIAEMIHAHPTFSEAVMESMRTIQGRAIHI